MDEKNKIINAIKTIEENPATYFKKTENKKQDKKKAFQENKEKKEKKEQKEKEKIMEIGIQKIKEAERNKILAKKEKQKKI